MKKVFVADNPLVAQFARHFLESAGIPAVVRGEHLFAVRGGVPMTEETLPSVCVLYEEDFERAVALLERIEARARFRIVDSGRDGGGDRGPADGGDPSSGSSSGPGS